MKAVSRVAIVASTVCLALLPAISGVSSAAIASPSPRAVVLVDASESMRGYFSFKRPNRRSSIRNVCESLSASLQSSGGRRPEIRLFKTPWKDGGKGVSRSIRSLSVLDDPRVADGDWTYIEQAFNEVKGKYDEVWIITDNVQSSARADVNADLGRFYDAIHAKDTAALDLYAMRPGFDGPLWMEDGASRLTDRYVGERALIAYGVLRTPALMSEYKTHASAVEQRLSEDALAAHLRIKPLVGPGQVELTIAEPGEEQVPENSRLEMIDPTGRSSRYVLESPVLWAEGQDIEGAFAVRFEWSGKQPTVVENLPVSVGMEQEFRRADFVSEAFDADADPSTVTIGAKQGDEVLATFRVPGGVRFRPTWTSLVRAAKSVWRLGTSDARSGEVTGSVRVTLGATSASVRLQDDFLVEWDTTDKAAYFGRVDRQAQRRVFGLDSLFRRVRPEESQQVTQSQVAEVSLRIAYPVWPTYALAALAGFCLAGAGGGAWLLGRPLRWELGEVLAGQFKFKSRLGASTRPPVDFSADEWGTGQSTGREDEAELPAWKLMTVGSPVQSGGVELARLRWLPLIGWMVFGVGGALVEGTRKAKRLESGVKREFTVSAAGGVEQVPSAAGTPHASVDRAASGEEESEWK